MSRSARRLTGAVTTGRFDWQPRREPADCPVADPSDSPADESRPGHPLFADAHEIRLPSAIAERTRAIEREMFAKGYAEAERVSEEAAAARVEPVIARLVATIDEIAALRVGMLRRTERDLVQLAIAMAERIIHRELTQDRDLLVMMARVAIDRLGENIVASIHLNPVDYDATLASREPSASQAVTLVSDPGVARGGCRVASAFGIIDAGIDTQIHELTRALLGDEPQADEPQKDDSDGVTVGS